MAETKPTPSEIERAQRILAHIETRGYSHSFAERMVAQTLADAREQERERCAKICDAVSDAPVSKGFFSRPISLAAKMLAGKLAAAIRRGEP